MTAWFIKADPKATAKLDIRYCHFTGEPFLDSGHIFTEGDTAHIRNVTIFTGNLTHWGAIKWGVLGILRIGPLRVKRIKNFFAFGGSK